jgi:hypothetical protein
MFENFRREDIRLLTRTEYDRVSYEKVYSTILKEDCTSIVGLRRT